MRLQIESTEKLTTLDGVPVRMWKGVTDQGVECFVFVHRIAAPAESAEEFDRQLREELPPGRMTPFRMLID